MADDAPLSALVVLRPGPGRELGDRGPVTAETIGEYLPSPEAVAAAQAAFAALGFEASAAVGPSFSITALRSRFEQVFGTADGLELPLDRLPADVRPLVQAVTFTPPPDFGPTEFG
jgi:hypothetical protein